MTAPACPGCGAEAVETQDARRTNTYVCTTDRDRCRVKTFGAVR